MPQPNVRIGAAAITENLLKRRWSFILLRYLEKGLTDPADILRAEVSLSPKVLNERLRTMHRYELIARFPRPGPENVIEYRLTKRGKMILDTLKAIERLDQELPLRTGETRSPFTAAEMIPRGEASI